MAGGNLEIVKFAFYLAVPIAIMGYFGNTAFYKDQVFPDRSRYWPEHKGPKIPTTQEELEEAMAGINKQRAEWRATAEAEGLLPARPVEVEEPPKRLV